MDAKTRRQIADLNDRMQRGLQQINRTSRMLQEIQAELETLSLGKATDASAAPADTSRPVLPETSPDSPTTASDVAPAAKPAAPAAPAAPRAGRRRSG